MTDEENSSATTIDLRDELKSMMDSDALGVTDIVRKSIKDAVIQQIEWKTKDQIGAEVTKFVQEEILPEVRDELMANKDAIIEQFKGGALEITSEIVKGMVTNATNNLTSYRGKEVIKSIFG